MGGCYVRVAKKTCSSRCTCDFCSGSGGPARESVRAAKPAHSPPLAERRAPRTPPLVQPPRSCRLLRERLGGGWPSAEACVPARPPLLETVEAVEAPQPPGRMPLRQHAKYAALPHRSRGERAFPHGKDPFYSRQGLQQFLQLFRDVYRYTAGLHHLFSTAFSTAFYSIRRSRRESARRGWRVLSLISLVIYTRDSD